MSDRLKNAAAALLARAGVKINGKNCWDIRVRNPLLYQRVFRQGSLGLGEAYLDGWWDCQLLDQFFYRVLRADLAKYLKGNPRIWLGLIGALIFNRQSKRRAFAVGEKHYDLGNDLYKAMLDKRMIYSCAYWKKAKNLDQAQEAKLDLICKKLGLKRGLRLLDIGCGWGGLLKYAAEKYGVSGVGLTVSKEQADWAKETCRDLPIEIRLQDYRDLPLDEKFDRIVSVGMFEHVGRKNYRIYFEVVERCLKDGGIFLLHTIGSNSSNTSGDPWIDKYIFPNGMLPSAKQIGSAAEGLFVMEDWHNFGADYDKTLLAWFDNFNKNWGWLKKKYSQRFYRIWKYYLLSCAGLFRARRAQLWQIVFSKDGRAGGYLSVR